MTEAFLKCRTATGTAMKHTGTMVLPLSLIGAASGEPGRGRTAHGAIAIAAWCIPG